MLRAQSPKARIGPRETIVMLAGLMALNAFAIDIMIPALPDLGEALGVVEDNRRQLVIVAYMLGFGATQLVWGPLADRFGRKPVLASGIALYTFFGLMGALAGSFELLVASRAAMGASAAVTRVLVVAMVRDLYEGDEMARIMSLVFMVFMAVPVLAPLVGQFILLFGPWRTVFFVLAAYGLVMLAWSWMRLPETIHPEYRREFRPMVVWDAIRQTLTDRLSLGYTLAMTVVFGGLTAYIVSIQQLVFDVFNAPELIGFVFAIVAAPIAVASWANSRIVTRYGVRRVSHVGIIAFLLFNVMHLLVATNGDQSLWLFSTLMAAAMACFAFTSANFSTLAMTNMAHIAGTASSIQGTINTVGGALLGFAIGQAFDGTQMPFLIGITLCAGGGLLVVFATERGRLFERPNHHAPCP